MLFWLAEGCSFIFNNSAPHKKCSYRTGCKFYLCAWGGKKGKLNLSMSVLSSNDFHCLLRVIVKALISLWLQCTNFKGAVFFCLNPAPSSSMLFVKTRLFPSLHVRILKIPFSFFLVSTCRQSEKGWANAETEQAKGYQNNQAANICWQLLDNICLPLFEEKACCPC